MVDGAAGAIVEQEHRGGSTEGGEVGVGEEEGGSGESTKSRAGEVEGMDRYVGEAKGASGSTKEGGVEADRLVGCGKEGGGHSEGSVEEGEEGRVGRCEGGVEGEVAVGEDAGVEKGDNSRAV
ncbi:uncharacterized protein MONOS_16583 [Monocercomonoides exilis]|uniref:uncharacterized protein n=1 Tax=Monocercomonoides exilis TaxID=2049356 RepID=UPI003559A27E|nr:hypothetical protein MONOS_16583 [Monocercomonoides exilis]|eukprot:MONOS_16583.1-p1 / transcript=MONOS_16583.1 / gene=MONOS_16583 / organism=Monocercomonoides_exilis_PA203 / gene_product=unspecified product / transcript_product=unspecified product / location=Mono_scaffold01883:1349-1717(-) / protein_length=123 / sequence_SO=supercontig / SO=protein_coding / is_pseudo=false